MSVSVSVSVGVCESMGVCISVGVCLYKMSNVPSIYSFKNNVFVNPKIADLN
jgi:hypothetical protein